MQAHRILIAITIVIAVAFAILAPIVEPAHAGTLNASTTIAWHPHHERKHHSRHHHRHPHSRTASYKPTGLRYVAYDDEQCTAQDTVPQMQAHGANVFRYIVPANPAETDQGIPCIQAARADGYRTYLSIQYDASDKPRQVAAHIQRVLNAYGPEWAVAIGNEEDFTETTAQYIQDWDAAEPMLAKLDPSAIRVLADAPPEPVTGRPEHLIKSRPVGAQAYAYHCYKADGGGLVSAGLREVPQLARFAQAYGLPLWCSEMTPGINPTSWLVRQTIPGWEADVRRIVSRAPNLQMISWYVWPSIGAY